MNTKEQKTLINITILLFSICIGSIVFWPLTIFFISNSQSKEPFIEFFYVIICDLIISASLFTILRMVIFRVLEKNIFNMYINNQIITIESPSKKLQYQSPDIVYRDCTRNKKVMERIIGFKSYNEIIFVSFDEECDLRIIDNLYRNKYSESSINIKGKVLNIKKLTTT